MTAVHQFHPVLAPGDAMSNHVFALRDRLRSWGYESDAFAVQAKAGVENEALSYRRLFRTVRPEDTLILHFSMGNEVFDQLVKIPARRVLVYHNITPPEFFSGINDHAAAFARLGLRQLEQIAPAIDLAIGISAFNRQDLDDMGFRKTAHVPILIDWKLYDTAPDPAVLARWSVFGRKVLFVGRISPNKRHDDLLRMFAYYRAAIDREAQLLLVGSWGDHREYYARLRELQRALGLETAVTFTGGVSLAALVAYYREADAPPPRPPARHAPTPSSRCRSTKGSACRSSRRCASTCRSSRTTPPRSARPSAARACCCTSAISRRRRKLPRS